MIGDWTKKINLKEKKIYLLRAFIHKGNRELVNQRLYIHVPIRIFFERKRRKKKRLEEKDKMRQKKVNIQIR